MHVQTCVDLVWYLGQEMGHSHLSNLALTGGQLCDRLIRHGSPKRANKGVQISIIEILTKFKIQRSGFGLTCFKFPLLVKAPLNEQRFKNGAIYVVYYFTFLAQMTFFVVAPLSLPHLIVFCRFCGVLYILSRQHMYKYL